jgi:hypothetical protein
MAFSYLCDPFAFLSEAHRTGGINLQNKKDGVNKKQQKMTALNYLGCLTSRSEKR